MIDLIEWVLSVVSNAAVMWYAMCSINSLNHHNNSNLLWLFKAAYAVLGACGGIALWGVLDGALDPSWREIGVTSSFVLLSYMHVRYKKRLLTKKDCTL